jgi:hypothetical protein
LRLLALASAALFVGVGGLVGVKLLLLARRTRQLPELSVGLGFFFVALIGYPLSVVGVLPEVPLPVARVAFCVGMAAVSIGSVSIYVFTWRVFRPDEGWARAVALASMAALVVFGVLSIAGTLGASGAPRVRDGWLIPRQLVTAFSYGWTAVEGLRWYGMQRRRLTLGLADARVANRFLLWGLSGTFAFLGSMGSTAVALFGADPAGHPVSMLSVGIGGFVTSVSIYLAFVPPAAYLRWVAGRGVAAA